MYDKYVILTRGVPGCGKSSLARAISPHNVAADDFMVDSNGQYHFNRNKLGYCHEKCYQKFLEFLMDGDSPVVVHNTFTRASEWKHYEELARVYGYKVFFVVVENRHGNSDVHGVPAETLERMEHSIKSNLKLRA
jgi:predicted kinase